MDADRYHIDGPVDFALVASLPLNGKPLDFEIDQQLHHVALPTPALRSALAGFP